MDAAKDKDDFIVKIAQELQSFDRIYFEPESLRYDGIMDDWMWEYNEYIELDDDAFSQLPDDELRGWQRDHVIDIRETLALPKWIDKPESYISFKWMTEFTGDHADNQKFFKDAIRALRNKHPFRGFRSALDWNGLTDEWYAYRDSRMEDYVRMEIDVP